jgi:hypothetical protein
MCMIALMRGVGNTKEPSLCVYYIVTLICKDYLSVFVPPQYLCIYDIVQPQYNMCGAQTGCESSWLVILLQKDSNKGLYIR